MGPKMGPPFGPTNGPVAGPGRHGKHNGVLYALYYCLRSIYHIAQTICCITQSIHEEVHPTVCIQHTTHYSSVCSDLDAICYFLCSAAHDPCFHDTAVRPTQTCLRHVLPRTHEVYGTRTQSRARRQVREPAAASSMQDAACTAHALPPRALHEFCARSGTKTPCEPP